MPRRPALAQLRLNNVTTCLNSMLTLLNELNDAFAPPFLLVISNTVLALVTAVQHVKNNKDDCLELMENLHQVLYAIVDLHMKSEPIGSPSLKTIHSIGEFAG
ncbi:hypothetical protein DFH06DRAFT_1337179 [Mycena polygramma]|nr:hypothetical protein DFH06DRAFT_1337179 [Mycena polygramma]